jgi:hypothetical protein
MGLEGMVMSNKSIENILHYILNEYPYPSDLTKTRITKIVYLVDWYSALENGQQLSNINWYFDHYGPYVSDVLDVADDDKKVKIKETVSAYGGVKYIVEPKDKNEKLEVNLSEKEIKIISQVIKDTEELSWNKFIDFVYDTAPIKNKNKYSSLNLSELAKEEKDSLKS